MSEKTVEGYCATCPTGCLITKVNNLITAQGEEATQMADITVMDFSVDEDVSPDELMQEMGELTSPVTMSDLVRQGLSNGDIESLRRAGEYALDELGKAATGVMCTGPVDDICPVPEANEIHAAYVDAVNIHLFK